MERGSGPLPVLAPAAQPLKEGRAPAPQGASTQDARRTPPAPAANLALAEAFAEGVPQKRDEQPHIVVSAVGSWHPQVPEGMVGVTAARGGRVGHGFGPDERHFLVPRAEYGMDGGGHFVIDPECHQEIPDFDPIAGQFGSREAGKQYLEAKAKGVPYDQVHSYLADNAGALADATGRKEDHVRATEMHDHARFVHRLNVQRIVKSGGPDMETQLETCTAAVSHHTKERDRHWFAASNLPASSAETL